MTIQVVAIRLDIRQKLLYQLDKELGEQPFNFNSGKSSELEGKNFPELASAVAQVVGLEASALPKNLKQAIAQYGERVEGAIACFHQQQKRKIENPVSYLYEAIISGWTLPVLQTPSIVPLGFNGWFNRTRSAGLVGRPWRSMAFTTPYIPRGDGFLQHN